MRLIDADALLSGYDVRKVVEFDESGCGLDYKAVPVRAIETAPTVNAVPVRYGRWEQSMSFVRCSECLTYWCVREKMSLIHIAKEDLKYCPNCGARMGVM